jgi:hypothetical protein
VQNEEQQLQESWRHHSQCKDSLDYPPLSLRPTAICPFQDTGFSHALPWRRGRRNIELRRLLPMGGAVSPEVPRVLLVAYQPTTLGAHWHCFLALFSCRSNFDLDFALHIEFIAGPPGIP